MPEPEWKPWRGPWYSVWNAHTIYDVFGIGQSYLGALKYFFAAFGLLDIVSTKNITVTLLLGGGYIGLCFLVGSIYMIRKWYKVSAHYSNAKQHWLSMREGLGIEDNKKELETMKKELSFFSFKLEGFIERTLANQQAELQKEFEAQLKELKSELSKLGTS